MKIIKCGGGRNDSMNPKLNYTPESIQILFDNPKLEIIKILCLLNALVKYSKKQRTIEEILFYYSVEENNKMNNSKDIELVSNNFYRFETKINRLLILMNTLDFIQINGKITDKIEKIKIKLSLNGQRFFEENRNFYLDSLFSEYVNCIEQVPYSKNVLKKIKEEGRYE